MSFCANITRQRAVECKSAYHYQSIKGWWANDPYDPVQEPVFAVEFTYTANGLIDAVIVRDDFYAFFDGENWAAADVPPGEAAVTAPVTTCQYIYYY